MGLLDKLQTAGSNFSAYDGKNPTKYDGISQYQEDLSSIKQLIVLNKIDLIDEDTRVKQLSKIKKAKLDKNILCISNINQQGIKDLVEYLYKEYTFLDENNKIKKEWSPI
jgi:GTPase involved in cell partitioning and DNA repair